MRRIVLFLPFLVFLVLGVVFYFLLGKDTQYMPSALIGQPVPSFQLVTLEGEQVKQTSDLPKGSYLINFWGTWCPSCHVEHPYLMTLAEQGVTIVGIDYKDQQAAAMQWLRDKGNPYTLVLMDELGQFGLDMGVTGAPETFVINAEGKIAYRLQGVLNAQSWQVIKAYL
ncbi:DsbE family thiol:disulfide interchange protein [Marinomonas aquiplantarum]|uniref:Cytochrome c biogenesis protein CcmG/thiol:disulfide interchange protein DsbE n=1 Tax=Marinomonas aquiplantarum TaxID=491951 RepID=A0A366D186_9GAMM|nr:DsbE family thiol:disulfide interchange protein [Marinomonas aquiplantarum]RBO83259.1 cytochrome c biogenesis protein CcmG/thiol:disulfide interchange protein DsbE [Marinomonas aquiplantarum]